jgi:hypothetical protein
MALPPPCAPTFRASIVDSELLVQLCSTMLLSSWYGCTLSGPDVHTRGRHAKLAAMDKVNLIFDLLVCGNRLAFVM